jgi:hypothetical protein
MEPAAGLHRKFAVLTASANAGAEKGLVTFSVNVDVVADGPPHFPDSHRSGVWDI